MLNQGSVLFCLFNLTDLVEMTSIAYIFLCGVSIKRADAMEPLISRTHAAVTFGFKVLLSRKKLGKMDQVC